MMKRVYLASDPVSANVLKARLEDAGISAVIQDERTQSMHGEVPFVYPSVWVAEEDQSRASAIAQEMDQPNRPTGKSWTCPACGEVLESSFTECWKCASQPQLVTALKPPAAQPSQPSFSRAVILGALVLSLAAVFVIYKLYSIESVREQLEAAYRSHDAGYYDAAIDRYCAVLAQHPDNVDALLNRGIAYYAKFDVTSALVDLERVIELKPTTEYAHEYRAYCYLERGRYRAALQDLIAASIGNGYRPDLKVRKLHCKYLLGDLEAARKDADQLVHSAILPSITTAYLALIDLEEDNPRGAEATILKAVELDGKDFDVRLTHAWILESLGRNDAALKASQEALLLLNGKSNCDLSTLRGSILYRLNDPAYKQELTTALILATPSKDDLGNKAFAHTLLDQDSEARAALSQYLQNSGECRWALYQAACLTLHLSRAAPPSEREAALNQALDYLETSRRLGLKSQLLFAQEPFFQALHSHPRFKKLAGLP